MGQRNKSLSPSSFLFAWFFLCSFFFSFLNFFYFCLKPRRKVNSDKSRDSMGIEKLYACGKLFELMLFADHGDEVGA